MADIHNYKKRLERTLERIKESKEISQHNKKLILNFYQTCIIESLSTAKTERYIYDAFRFAQFYKKSLDKATEKIISELKEKGKSETEILSYVNELTGMKKERISGILKVWRYGKKFVKLMGDKESFRTFLVQSEDVFLPLIKTQFPDIAKKYPEEELRKIIGEKLLDKKLGDTTWVFRNLRDSIKDNCKSNKDKIDLTNKLFDHFLSNKEVSITQIIRGIEEYTKSEDKRIVDIVKTKKDIQKIDVEVIIKSINQKEVGIYNEKFKLEESSPSPIKCFNQETKKEIAEARKRIAQGEFYTQEEAERILKIK